MRILIDYRPALVQRTGVGEYTHELARAMLPQLPAGDRLTLFSSSWSDRLEAGRLPGASVVDVRVPVRALNLAWHRLEWPPVERFSGPVDIAHSMHPLLMPARGAAQVVTIYDLFFLENASGTATEIRRDYPSLAASHARRADLVVVISEYTAAEVRRKLGVPEGRIVLCPPGAPSWEPRRTTPPSGPVLFIGSPERRKNVPGLLRAYGRLRERWPDAPKLVLAGRTPDRGSEIQALIRRPPCYPHVRHLGYVSDGQRQQLYREASLLVVPSLDEGFGMPALEAMTVGLPVVAANRGALPEVIGDGGLLVDPTDEDGLADAMFRMLTTPSLAEACVARGFARSRLYTWEASAATLLRGYGDALERRRPAA